MRVIDWLEDYLADFWPTHGLGGFPGRGEPGRGALWSSWLNRLIDLKATRVEATLASRRLQGQEFADAEEWLGAVAIEIGLIRQGSTPRPVAFVLGSTPEERRAQCEALLDELYEAGFTFTWDAPARQFRCVPAEGPPLIPTADQCARIRALNRGLWTLLAPLRDPDPEPDLEDIPIRDWRSVVRALADRATVGATP